MPAPLPDLCDPQREAGLSRNETLSPLRGMTSASHPLAGHASARRRRKARPRPGARANTALIIVDVQREFPIPPQMLNRIEAYSRTFPCRVFTRFINPPGSFFRRKLKMTCCAPNSKGTELLIPPQRGDIVFDKHGYGLDSAQLQRLKRRGISRAVVCGLETDACVLGIMFSLFDAEIDARIEPTLCWSSTGLHLEALQIIAMQFETQ